jgi:hypothetical protein
LDISLQILYVATSVDPLVSFATNLYESYVDSV